MEIKGEVAVVTRASSGIGRATFILLAEKRAKIACTTVFLIENDYVSGLVVNLNASRYMNWRRP